MRHRVLLIILCSVVLGCSTEYNAATGRQESFMYGDDKEAAIGAAYALSIDKQAKLITDVDINQRAETILKRIVAVCDRQDIVYTIRVIDDDLVNAFSLPGGYVYLYKGLIDLVKSDDELASVVAHEVAHIVAKHSMKRLQAAYGAMILQGGAIAARQFQLAQGINLTTASVIFANSRDDEFESDALGVKYLRLSGYDVSAMRSMLAKLSAHQAKEPLRPLNYWRTHPYLPQRIARASQKADRHGAFRDYLNTVGEDR